jgi:hypothetical protein
MAPCSAELEGLCCDEFSAVLEWERLERVGTLSRLLRFGIENRRWGVWPGRIAAMLSICFVCSAGVLPSLRTG